ncbi:uncharacterized protein LOC119792303 isoform X2 [Cyprinodon tularosa]|uniref:uncharacterized protein LOC119792303 isoform X2 n=1 Tax=Cyprinodon tularosa TaxID=77115 RepID=UPI0018E27856|nr:uncharacterized protein LOC119792303 isoform X2 [Cyprinodon tularosa]
MAAGRMDALTTSFLLLLPSFASFFDSKVTLLKTVRKEPDSTPIYTNESSNIIIIIACQIRTERNKGEECRLLYRDGGDFVHQCDSRFTLKTLNHTVFLHLTSLTAADSGNYTCECAKLDGIFILHLNIIVKDNGEDENERCFSEVTLPSALTAAALLFTIVLIIVGFVHRRHLPCTRLKSEASASSVQGSVAPKGEENSNELYRSLQQPTADLYQTVSSGHHQQETERTSAGSRVTVNRNYEIYENL